MKFEIAQEDQNIKKQALGLQEAELKRNHIKKQELAEHINRQQVGKPVLFNKQFLTHDLCLTVLDGK